MEIPRWLWIGALVVAVLLIAYGIYRQKQKKPTSRGMG